MTNRLRFAASALFSAVFALAQTSTSINLKIVPTSFSNTTSNAFIFSENGSVAPLGNATLAATHSESPIGQSGAIGPVQIGAALYFNEVDSFAFSFTESDVNFYVPDTFTMSDGIINGGTGKYAGATGSITLTVTKLTTGASYSSATTKGSGTITFGGNTTPFILNNFSGSGGFLGTLRERDYFTDNTTVTGTLGNGTGTISGYYLPLPQPVIGSGTINFNSADQLSFWYSYAPRNANAAPPATFGGLLQGGTGKYAGASGQLSIAYDDTGYSLTSTMTIPASSAPKITQVKTAFGAGQVAFNTWLQINGTNLVPADTPATGVDWSNAPEFADGKMPTQLGGISVTINGLPAYVYFYCSAATDPACAAGDQINVLAPLLPLANEGPGLVVVTTNGVNSNFFPVFRSKLSPTLFTFDVTGHVVARHLDASLVGPTTLYPGLTTPAKPGETISVVGSGFGLPTNGPLVAGSASQSGPLGSAGLGCIIGSQRATTVGALVGPGLYQFNITIPVNTPSGDNLVNCVYNGYATSPGTLIALQ